MKSLIMAVLMANAAPAVAGDAGWTNSLAPRGVPGPEVTLARDGKTAYRILLPRRPTTQETKGAEELAVWLQEMTGAHFPAVREGTPDAVGGRVISVGRTRRLAELALPEGAADLREEGYGIAQRGQDLFLFGASRRGPLYAVYSFLEEDLGCRWYTRGTHTIPHAPTLTCRPVSRTFVPPLEIRDPFYWDAFEAEWSLRNRTNSPRAPVPSEWGGHMQAPWFTHGFNDVLSQSAFHEHPEYFATIDGRKSNRQLCLTHPAVFRITVEKVREALAANPHARLLSVADYDGGGHCECPDCKALDDANGSPAGSLITFVNRVAENIESDFPDVKISTLAYLDRIDAPTRVRPRRNVAIQLCNDLHSWRWPLTDFTRGHRELSKRYRDAVAAWSTISQTVHVWDYFTNFSHYMGPIPNMHVLAPSVDYYMEHEVKGIMFQGSYQGPGASRAPLRSWVMAKLLWDPSRDVDGLQRDFIRGYYAESAPPLEAYNEFLNRLGMENRDAVTEEMGGIRFGMDAPFLDRSFLRRAAGFLRDAESRARTDETRRRVRLARLPLLYVKMVRGPAFAGDGYTALLDEFEAITRLEGVNYTREGGPDVKEKIDYWRGMAAFDHRSVSWEVLGNVWRVQIDPDDIGTDEKWYAEDSDDSEWADVRSDTGNGWESQGFPAYTGHAWYRQWVAVPEDVDQRDLFHLLFGAVDEEAEIYINGEKAFDHTEDSTGIYYRDIWTRPFLFDARPHLKPGEKNLIAVRVYNRMGMGGIWKPVYLVSADVPVNPRVLFEVIQRETGGAE